MDRPLSAAPRTAVAALVLLASAAGCDRRVSAVSEPVQPGPVPGLDRPWPGVADGGAERAAPLRAFTCRKEFRPGKSPQGPFSIRFVPRNPTDVSYHLEYHCGFNCWGTADYSVDLRIENGQMKNTLLDHSPDKIACRRSPLSGFAVDCGPFLGSDLDIHVRSGELTRKVNFRMPFFFTEGLPDPDPSLPFLGGMPFVHYDKSPDGTPTKSIDNARLDFPLDQCQFDP
jgi:hypothetical protein